MIPPIGQVMAQNLVELNIIRHSGKHLAELTAAGLEVVAPTDFAQIADMVEATGRNRQTPMLSLNRNDFTNRDAFWLFLMKDGQPIAGTAARYTDLGGESFDSYLRRTSKEQYGRQSDPILSVAPPVVSALQGRLIYLGELELHPDHRGRPWQLYRYARIMMGMAVLRWPNFNALYAFVPKQHLKLADGYGFSWKVPRAITWADPVPEGRLNDHWLVATFREDFAHAWSGEEPFDM
ncbi:MAG: hypothetical protein AB3N23_11005 [Paracoccaceae bacterium]